jgi:hypothetical protein
VVVGRRLEGPDVASIPVDVSECAIEISLELLERAIAELERIRETAAT